MRNILIVGGCGYIGRQIVDILINKKKYKIFVIDNLSTTNKNYLNNKINFFKLDITDKSKLTTYFKINKIDDVIHLAAKCIIPEGERFKTKYYKNNVIGTKNLVNICLKNKIKNFIFSSTCAVFSNNIKVVNENSLKKPKSYYGKTKLMSEKIIRTAFKNTKTKFIILRYFNVVGANIKKKIGEFNSKDRLFNNFSKQIINKKNIYIYGNNYKTRDGTCIRDFIHVYDLANIHIKCLDLFQKISSYEILNCGYGKGFSILEIAKIFKKIIKQNIKILYKKQRHGDMEEIISSNKKLNKLIKWKPKFDNINQMVLSTYNWHSKISKRAK